MRAPAQHISIRKALHELFDRRLIDQSLKSASKDAPLQKTWSLCYECSILRSH